MNANNLIYVLVLGAVAGWLAGQIMRGGGLGLIGNIIVGVIGAFLGSWLFGVLNISAGSGLLGQLITSTVGAAVLLFLSSLIRRS